MFIRYLTIATAAAALLALTPVSAGAGEKAMSEMQHVDAERQIETAQTAADHETIAMRFENEAVRLEKQAADHERMAARYRSGVGVGPKANSASLANHCDSFVKNLRASANDARELARLHHDIGKALAK